MLNLDGRFIGRGGSLANDAFCLSLSVEKYHDQVSPSNSAEPRYSTGSTDPLPLLLLLPASATCHSSCCFNLELFSSSQGPRSRTEGKSRGKRKNTVNRLKELAWSQHRDIHTFDYWVSFRTGGAR